MTLSHFSEPEVCVQQEPLGLVSTVILLQTSKLHIRKQNMELTYSIK